jgi:hypothetical protein
MSAQPLHPSIIPKLDPEYVDFHNKYLTQIVPPHTIPWNPVTRNAVTMPGTSDPLNVGSTRDITLSRCKIRVFTPPCLRPSQGWPIFVFYHGGDASFKILINYQLTANCRRMDVRQYQQRKLILNAYVHRLLFPFVMRTNSCSLAYRCRVCCSVRRL